MIVDNISCEFGYELQLVIPYAYYLYINNQLEKTISCKKTKELYYFSNNHHEKYTVRRWSESELNVPNKIPFTKELNYNEYIPPPYKSIYKNEYFLYDKPLLIIHNKYNTEWGHSPVNYIDKNTLENIFEYCHLKYKIIYIRPKSENIVNDHSNIHDLNEGDIIKKYEVIDANDLYLETKDRYNIDNFNYFQLLIHSNCNHFISVQGGNSVLASYFGGTNIIYAKKGEELNCDCFHGHYKKYSDCNIFHSNDYNKFVQIVKDNY